MKLFFKLCIVLLLSIINSVYANEGTISISSKFNELTDLYSIEYQNKNAQDAYFRYKEHDISEWSNYIVMSKDTSGNFSGYAIFNSPGQKQIEIALPQSAGTIQPVLNTFIQVNPKKNGKEVEGGLFIGRYENDFLIPATYFSNTDEIAIRFQFFRPINQIQSFSVYLNGFDVTSLVANIVKIREGYTYPSVEAIIPPFLVTALSTTTGNDSFVVTEINGKFYFSFIKISSTISTRRILPVAGVAAVASYLATACSVGAISSATVSILDFFIDMQIDYTGILPIPLIGYSGKTIDDFSNNIDNFATEIGNGCLTSVALSGTKFIPGVNQFVSKIQSKIYQNMSSTYLPTFKAKILSFLTKLTEIPKTLSPFDKYTAASLIVTEFTDQIVSEIKSSWITPLKDLFFEYINPSIVTISPNSGETYTTNAININVEATNADEILYNLTYSTSNVPTDPEEPTIEKYNGKIVGNKGVINTGSFSIQPKAGQLTIYKIKFRSNSFAGYGGSTVVTYLFDLRANLPDNIIASPLNGTWTTTPQLLSVSANNAERIYCMVEETNDGTIPNDPPIPSETLNDPCVQGGSFISGTSGQFQLWGETGKLKNIKIRFRAWNQQGFSSVSPIYNYSIDLHTSTVPTKTIFQDCEDCPEMVTLTGGTFKIGNITNFKGNNNELPVHDVTLNSFAIGKYEVSRKDFRKFINATNYVTEAEKKTIYISACAGGYSTWKNIGIDDSYPVVCLTWLDIQKYIEWLSNLTQQTYRLPTEAEWEYAIRGGTTTDYWWGNIKNEYCTSTDCDYKYILENAENCYRCDIWAKSSPVGSLLPNSFGLYDMGGNVSELTCSKYTDNYIGEEIKCLAEANNPNLFMVVRGASWLTYPEGMRSAQRGGVKMDQTSFSETVGFRLVRTSNK
jgi:formylglycine-generating enzyme required for sulfatase activity